MTEGNQYFIQPLDLLHNSTVWHKDKFLKNKTQLMDKFKQFLIIKGLQHETTKKHVGRIQCILKTVKPTTEEVEKYIAIGIQKNMGLYHTQIPTHEFPR